MPGGSTAKESPAHPRGGTTYSGGQGARGRRFPRFSGVARRTMAVFPLLAGANAAAEAITTSWEDVMATTRRDVLKLSLLGGAVAVTASNAGPALAGVPGRKGGADDAGTAAITTPSRLAPA